MAQFFENKKKQHQIIAVLIQQFSSNMKVVPQETKSHKSIRKNRNVSCKDLSVIDITLSYIQSSLKPTARNYQNRRVNPKQIKDVPFKKAVTSKKKMVIFFSVLSALLLIGGGAAAGIAVSVLTGTETTASTTTSTSKLNDLFLIFMLILFLLIISSDYDYSNNHYK